MPYTEKDTEGKVELRNIVSGSTFSLDAPDFQSANMQFSADGTFLILETYNVVRIWDVNSWHHTDFPLMEGDRQFFSLKTKNNFAYPHAVRGLDEYNGENGFDYEIKLKKPTPFFIKRYQAKTEYGEENNLSPKTLSQLVRGWTLGNIYNYQSAGLSAVPNSGWARYVKCRDNALVARDCDIQFIPIQIEPLMQQYDKFLWQPSKEELIKYGFIE